MGDRGNIKITYSQGEPIYFYTHWRGSEIKSIAKTALSRKQRWDDDSYLARIIFSEMIKGREAEETGFGISPYQIEEGSPLLTVDTEKQTVTFKGKTVSFEKFIS